MRRGARFAVALAVGLGSMRAGRADEPSPTVPAISFEWSEVVEPDVSALGGTPEFMMKAARDTVDLDPESMPNEEIERLLRELLEDAPPAPVMRRDQPVSRGDWRPPSRSRRPGPPPQDEGPTDEAEPPLEVTADPSTPASPAPPDDRGFLDVVLVGTAAGYHCTAVVIAPTVVLTAAHCAPATQVAIAHRVTQPFASVAVVETIVHPTVDAAVLRLARDVPVPPRIRRRAADRAAPVGAVRVVGFGVDDVRHPASFGVKRRVDAVARGWGCDQRRARAARCRSGVEMVLTAVGGGDTCRGDSGGPVLESTPQGYRLIAIVSRATATGGAVCGRGGVYVRVDAIDPWLTSILEESR